MPFGDIVGHERPKSWLRAALHQNRLAHAYLFTGDEAIGKRSFGIRLAQTLTCETPPAHDEPDSCGECRSCRQIEQGSHPDFLLIEPDADKANPQISIDRVRDVEHHVIYRPLISPYKICLIDQADRLTPSAANALLKTLEEPPDHSLFLLITSRPAALLATVRSRCLRVPFSPPAQSQVEGALILKRALPPEDARFLTLTSQCRIGQALLWDVADARSKHHQFAALLLNVPSASVGELLDSAESLAKDGNVQESFAWLSASLRDMLFTSTGAERECLLNADYTGALRQLAQTTSVDTVIQLIEEFQTLEQASKRNINLQLGLEAFFLKFQQACTLSPI